MIKWFFLFISLISNNYLTSQENYIEKDYKNLFGMQGFSDDLLKLHFKLYKGYVDNVNLLQGLLQEYVSGKQEPNYAYGALKRRFAWEFDGMRLHEYYFDNLGGKTPLPSNSGLYNQIAQDFGSFEAWKRDFIATGMMRGIGWSVLYWDPKGKKLFNTWINEHDLGHLAGGVPILVMDIFEHAYMPQYGLDRAGYIQAFFSNINWETVRMRFSNLAQQQSQAN